MLKRAIFLLAILLQIGVFSAGPVVSISPVPDCWPCAK